MLNDPLFIVAALASLVVLGVLILGVAGFARGGEFNRRNGNRLMRWRIGVQALAVVLILAFVYVRSNSG